MSATWCFKLTATSQGFKLLNLEAPPKLKALPGSTMPLYMSGMFFIHRGQDKWTLRERSGAFKTSLPKSHLQQVEGLGPPHPS